MATTIITKFGSGAPTASDVVRGELAVDTENGRLYTEDSGGSVVEIGLNPSGNVDVTGTVTADGLIKSDSTSNGVRVVKGSAAYYGQLSVDYVSNDVFTYVDSIAGASFNGAIKLRTADDGGSVADRVIINSTGVGIGTTSPNATLHVIGPVDTATISTSSTPAARINNGSAISNWIGANGYNYGYIQSIQDDGTNNLKPLALQPLGGNVGIGTTSPSALLHIASTGASNIKLEDTDNGFAATELNIENGGRDFKITTPQDTIFVQGSTEAMRIDSSGNVGIGTASPDAALDVLGSSGDQLRLRTAETEEYKIGRNSSTGFLDLYGTQTGYTGYTFGGVDGERMRIDSSGNLLVGTTTTTAGNEGMVYFNGSSLRVTRDSDEPLNLDRLTTDGSIIDFKKDGATVGSITANSGSGGFLGIKAGGSNELLLPLNSTPPRIQPSVDDSFDIGTASAQFKNFYLSGEIYNPAAYNQTTGLSANMYVNSAGRFFRSTSSERYKNTIQDATHGLTELLTLRPVTYKGNDDGDVVFGGLIAEEVHDAGLTEFVQYNEENQPDALAYGNMVSLCIKAIQEQQDLIESLTARIAALEGAN